MYSLIKVPVFANKSFYDFTKSEAQEYFQWFLKERENRIDILRAGVRESFPDWQSNYNRESLNELYEWFKIQVTHRPTNVEERESIKEQLKKTPLLENIIAIPEEMFSDETVSICFDVGLYLGEMLIKKNDLLKWTYKVNSPKYIYFAQPIIMKTGYKGDFNPRASMEIAAKKVLNKKTDSNLLDNLFEVWNSDFLN